MQETNINKLLESLSPNERKIIPYLKETRPSEIAKKTALDKVSVLRALEYLQNKELIRLSSEKRKQIILGINGLLYRKNGLPERRLLQFIENKKILTLEEAQKLSKLSENEFKASIGALKRKAMIDIKNGKIMLNAAKEEIGKKTLEEQFIDSLPLEINSLTPEQQFAFNSLKNRKEIVEIKEATRTTVAITELGKEMINPLSSLLKKDEEMIEQLTGKMIEKGNWKGKKFRRYDVTSQVPSISGGKRHFVNQALDKGRRIWTDLGFQEMTGTIVQSSFWNFDALFTAQDHPVREMQDTFFLGRETEITNKELMKKIKEAHEKGITANGSKSKGWQYTWNENESKKLVLRTHTTSISSQTLAKLKKEELPVKFFAIGKCFRNETVDWSHGFEFNQTEGIVIDKNANFRHLLGYLKEFFGKMGFEKIRFSPAYFPYTEPSVEIHVWHPERKVWLELGGAGIFRPEVSVPLLGEYIPILAWGPGFDRTLMDYYEIKDLRELYKNDLAQLRKMKFWMK